VAAALEESDAQHLKDFLAHWNRPARER